jgi:hypothetical protein
MIEQSDTDHRAIAFGVVPGLAAERRFAWGASQQEKQARF